MPWLSTPRKLPILIKKGCPSSPGGSSAPTMAQGTLMPTRAFGAPQTIVKNSERPTSTLQTLKRSALGCCIASLISPTTIFENGGATGLSSSTSRPAIVRTSANCSVVKGGLQNSRSQDSGNCILFNQFETNRHTGTLTAPHSLLKDKDSAESGSSESNYWN